VSAKSIGKVAYPVCPPDAKLAPRRWKGGLSPYIEIPVATKFGGARLDNMNLARRVAGTECHSARKESAHA
jgi:hypothetical protein